MIESRLRRTWGYAINRTCRFRDNANRIRFGREAPRYSERLWIYPGDAVGTTGLASRQMSGRVVADWTGVGSSIQPLESNRKIRAIWEHFGDGVPWEKTEEFAFRVELLMHRRAMSRSEAQKALLYKYRRYDTMFGEMKASGKLMTRDQVSGNRSFREEGGVLIHVGPDGQLVHGGHGNRRFAIAYLLDLRIIPAVVGLVYVESLRHLQRLRLTE